MRYAVGVVLFSSLTAAAFGQIPGHSTPLGGYSNVLLPGVAHPPQGPVAAYYAAKFGGGRPVSANHPQHGRTAIVPYPVFYGGGGYGYGNGYGYGSDPNAAYGPGYADQAPPVINSKDVFGACQRRMPLVAPTILRTNIHDLRFRLF